VFAYRIGDRDSIPIKNFSLLHHVHPGFGPKILSPAGKQALPFNVEALHCKGKGKVVHVLNCNEDVLGEWRYSSTHS
jgi:hypothetical protein